VSAFSYCKYSVGISTLEEDLPENKIMHKESNKPPFSVEEGKSLLTTVNLIIIDHGKIPPTE